MAKFDRGGGMKSIRGVAPRCTYNQAAITISPDAGTTVTV